MLEFRFCQNVINPPNVIDIEIHRIWRRCARGRWIQYLIITLRSGCRTRKWLLLTPTFTLTSTLTLNSSLTLTPAYRVEMKDLFPMSMQQHNNQVKSAFPLLGHRVTVRGTSRFDGKSGVAIDAHIAPPTSHPTESRYTVKLDTGDVFKVKIVNVACGDARAQAAARDHRLHRDGSPLSYQGR